MSRENNILLSGCVIALNDADRIKSCLDSLRKFCDEVLVVDGVSNDETKKIAVENGAKVVTEKWADNFSRQRNIAIENAEGEWIFMLDTDEEVTGKLGKKILELIRDTDEIGFFIPRKNYIDGEIVQSSAKYEMQPRLFRKNLRYDGAVHEKPQNSEKFARLEFAEDEYIVHKKNSKEQQKHLLYQKEIMLKELEERKKQGAENSIKEMEELLLKWNDWWKDAGGSQSELTTG